MLRAKPAVMYQCSMDGYGADPIDSDFTTGSSVNLIEPAKTQSLRTGDELIFAGPT